LPQLHRGMLEILGIKNADKLVPLEDDEKPKDPVSENQAVLKGKPVKAFLYQDHKAHVAVHMSMLQDPLIQQMIGQNPKAPMIQAALMAHIAEHAGYIMRMQVEQQLGIPLPPEDEKLPPQVEMALSAMMAQASQQALMQNQAQAAQQQAQQQAQDPVLQLQQQELALKGQEIQLKGREVDIKEKALMVDAAARADAQRLREKEVSDRTQLEAMKVSAKIEEGKTAQSNEQQRAGLKVGADAAKAKGQQKLQALQILANLQQKGDNT